jgi:hypothetical protein
MDEENMFTGDPKELFRTKNEYIPKIDLSIKETKEERV